MPRLLVGRSTGRGRQQLNAGPIRRATPTEQEAKANMMEEWQQRGYSPGMLQDALQAWDRAQHSRAFADADDVGAWHEVVWRLTLRGCVEDLSMYEEACTARGFKDTAGSRPDPLQLAQLVQAGDARKEARLASWWGGVSASEQLNLMLRFAHATANCRPHGFRSLGRVEPSSPLGVVLLHGLKLFLETSFSPALVQQLSGRLHQAAVVSKPLIEMLRFATTFADQNGATTFTGLLPPVLASVPLFDHLSLHRQLGYAFDVMTCLMPTLTQGGLGVAAAAAALGEADGDEAEASAPQPADTVFNWAAFNKLLLLGLLAPVEEAFAEQGTSHLVLEQQQTAAAARQAEAAGACSSMQQSLASFRCALHDGLAVSDALGRSTLLLVSAHQQEQQDQHPSKSVKQLQQQLQPGAQLSDVWQPQQQGSGKKQQSSSAGLAPQQLDQLQRHLAAAAAWPAVVCCSGSGACGGAANCEHPDCDHSHHQAAAGHLQQLLAAVVEGFAAAPDAGVSGGTTRSGSSDAPEGVAEWVHHSLLPLMRTRGPRPTDGGQQQSTCSSSAVDAAVAAADAAEAAAAARRAPAMALVHNPGLVVLAQQACQLLVARALSSAPPCEAWPLELCQQVLQLQLLAERVTGAATAHAYAYTALNATTYDAYGEQQQEQQEAQQQQHVPGMPLSNPTKFLLELVQAARRVEAAFEGLQQQAEVHKQQQQDATGAGASLKAGCRRGSNHSVHSFVSAHSSGDLCSPRDSVSHSQQQRQGQQQQQDLLRQHAGSPNLWREQLLALYKRRPAGLQWVKNHFEEVAPDTTTPGFWGVLRMLAASNVLNLRHREAPEAPAAMQPAYMASVFNQDEVYLGPTASRSRQLARMSNWTMQAEMSVGLPVSITTLEQLLKLACIAAQQPSLLAYAPGRPEPLKAAAAAAADAFVSPCSSPQPWADGGGGSDSDSVPAGQASAAAAADAWMSGVQPLHLQFFEQLGPLFEADQQGPCLARLLRLLLEHQQHCNAAALCTLRRLSRELQQRGLSEPGASNSSGASGSCSSSSRAPAGTAGSPADVAPGSGPDSSRLMVLLLGLYHTAMLQRQQAAQQQRRVLDRADVAPLPSPAGGAGCPYACMETRFACITEAVDAAAIDLRHLLLYAIDGSMEAAAAEVQAAAAASTGPRGLGSSIRGALGRPGSTWLSRRNSSSSRGGGSRRLGVCDVAAVLAADGVSLLQQGRLLRNQQTWQDGGHMLSSAALGMPQWPPPAATCDFCLPRDLSKLAQNVMLASAGPTRARATRACPGCGGFAWFCEACWKSADARSLHNASCCAARSAGQDAVGEEDADGWLSVPRAVMQRAYHALCSSSSTGPAPPGNLFGWPCACDSCAGLHRYAIDQVVLAQRTCPLGQLAAPSADARLLPLPAHDWWPAYLSHAESEQTVYGVGWRFGSPEQLQRMQRERGQPGDYMELKARAWVHFNMRADALAQQPFWREQQRGNSSSSRRQEKQQAGAGKQRGNPHETQQQQEQQQQQEGPPGFAAAASLWGSSFRNPWKRG